MQLSQSIFAEGLGNFQLDTAELAFAAFVNVVGYSTSCNYTIVSKDRSQYEYGTGQVLRGGAFQRDSVTVSSNANALVDFMAASHLIVISQQAAAGAVAAEDVSYDNATSGLAATDVQAAIDELAAASGGASNLDDAISGTGATLSIYISSHPILVDITNSLRDAENIAGGIANAYTSQAIVPALAYFEFEILTYSAPGYSACGVMHAMHAIRSEPAYMGSSAESWAYWSHGYTYTNTVGTSGFPTLVAGDIFGVAINRTTGKIWFSKNGTFIGSGDPAAGTGEKYSSSQLKYYMRAGCTMQNTGNKVRLRGTSSQLAYSPPTGFSAAFG